MFVNVYKSREILMRHLDANVYLSKLRGNSAESLLFNMGIFYCSMIFLALYIWTFPSSHNDITLLQNIAAQHEYKPPVTLLLPPPPKAKEAVIIPIAASAPVVHPAAPRPFMGPAMSAGNTYARGYCTWYAKSRRPDLPNNLGNANTWFTRANSQGIPTGTVPRAGAIGQRGWHVVYIERVNADGTVFVSEMNYKGWGITSTRSAPANSFKYIY